jgi:hypothetical protein
MAKRINPPRTNNNNAIDPSSRAFPLQRVSIRRGIYEYIFTFVLTTILLSSLMIAGPSGIESFLIKLFQ